MTAPEDSESAPALAPPSGLRWRLVASLRRVVTWWTILYGTGAATLEVAFSRHGPSGATPGDQAVKDVIYALVWAPVLLGAIALTEWRPIRAPIWRRVNVRRLALHGAALLIAPFAWGTAAYFLRHWAIPNWHPPAGVTLMWANTAGGILYVYGSIVIVCHLLLELQERQRRDAARLRVAEGAADAQLQTLLLELHPHFLGNALQAVSDLLRTAPSRAVHALAALRELLADALRAVHEQQVTLAQELRTLQCYLSLQALRYGERLRVAWDVPDEARAARVPAFILQPLVENAIKHSLDAVRDPLEIAILVRQDGPWLDLSVVDTGVGLSEPTPVGAGALAGGVRGRGAPARADGAARWPTRPRGGRGLRNVQDRLHHLYGALGSVRLEARPDRRGTVATVRLPFANDPTQDRATTATPATRREPAGIAPAAPANSAAEGRTRRARPGPPSEAAAGGRSRHDPVTRGTVVDAAAAPSPGTPALVRRAAMWQVLIAWHAVYAAATCAIDAFIVPQLPGRSPGSYAPLYRVIQVALWMVTLAIGLATAERWPVRSRRDGRRVLAQVVLWLGAAVAWGATAYLLAQMLGLWWSGRPLGRVIGVEAKGAFFAYVVMASLMHVLVNLHAARARDLAWRVGRQRLAEARVRLLALNLQSAGVLETLGDMTTRAASDPVGTDEGVVRLADVLHGYLDLAGEDTATTKELADLADAQARLVSWRTGASIRVAWSGPRTSAVRIPHALIWPLIEDALHRGGGNDAVVRVAIWWADQGPAAHAREGASGGRLLRIAVGVRTAGGPPDTGASASTLTAVRERARELIGDRETLSQISWTSMADPIPLAAPTGSWAEHNAGRGGALDMTSAGPPQTDGVELLDALTVPEFGWADGPPVRSPDHSARASRIA